MSADQHRREADRHERSASASQARYDPDAVRAHGNDPPDPNEFEFPENLYNPTEHHLDDARLHREHAKAHRSAADALERFEDEACARFPPATRSASPLIGQVEAVEDIDGGVRLLLAKGVNVAATVSHIRCHVAYGAKRGGVGMTACPLYVVGVTVRHDPGSASVKLTVGDPALVSELRTRAKQHASP